LKFNENNQDLLIEFKPKSGKHPSIDQGTSVSNNSNEHKVLFIKFNIIIKLQ